MMNRMRHKWLALLVLALGMLPVRGQVDICYDFEDATANSRPTGWDALPNLDYHHVGIEAYDNTAHTGSKAIKNNYSTCFTIMPDEGINYAANGVWLTFWYYLHLNTDYFDVGYLTDATDSSTFHLLATVHDWQQQWHFFAVDLSSVPTGARIAFFGHDIFGMQGTFWLDDMHLTSSPCAAWGLRVAENRSDSVRLEWQSAGSPTVTLTIDGTPHSVTSNSYTFARNIGSNHTASLIAQCPYSGCMPIQPSSTVMAYRYREGHCLDAADYGSSMATPYYGTPVQPYLHTGTYTTTASGVSGVYAGSHTINTNPGSDGGGMMVFPQTIPPGDHTTLRLGNRLGDWESASMLYTIDVDTAEADLLAIKYTVAMAFGPMSIAPAAAHNDTLHPAWFSIELLDTTDAAIPGSCQQFYLDMWDTSGWDEINSMYKRRNFTGMAFDLAPYHGQRVHLRVTATDGAVNNRWCYAYYNFECLKRDLQADGCSEGDTLTFTMPYGFLYRWWRDGDPATIANSQSITVPADSTLYHCELVNRFDPSCSQVVSRLALPRPQRWESDTVVENQLPYTWQGIVMDAEGDTSLILPSSTTGCDTTLHFHLHVWPNQQVRIEQPVCPADWPIVWDGDTLIGPDSVTHTFTDSHGADSTVTFVAVQVPNFEVFDTVVICPYSPFIWDSIDYGGPAVIDTLLATAEGCDSLLHIVLMPRDTAFALHALHSIDGHEWADTLPIAICANQTLHVIDSTEGSVEWQWTLLGEERESASEQFTISNGANDSLFITPHATLLTLIATSQEGCHDTLQWPVVVFPVPQAEFIWTPDHPSDISPDVQLINYSQPDTCSGWLWLVPKSPGSTDYDSLEAFEPIYRWTGDELLGDYDVRLVAYLTSHYDTLTHVCSDTATHTIEIITAWLGFPNLVTPNGDGENDLWVVVNLVELGQYPNNELWIYNQWGNLIYHASNISSTDQFWDPNATHSPDGTYFFRFTARSAHGIVKRNGTIEVLR